MADGWGRACRESAGAAMKPIHATTAYRHCRGRGTTGSPLDLLGCEEARPEQDPDDDRDAQIERRRMEKEDGE